MTTSLQKAVAAAKNPESSFQTSHGQFETCFAAGLDLGEFLDCGSAAPSSGKNGPPRRESASAQLLRVKEEEKRRKQVEEVAETNMQKVVQRRVSHIHETIKKNRQSNVVVNALVQMHGSDTSDPSIYRKNKKMSKKISPTRRHSPSVSLSAKKAHRKTIRIKY